MAPPEPPGPRGAIDLIIRFATSIPDLSLSIPKPDSTSVLTLKTLIRPHLPPAHSTSRLRLIASGKILPDTSSISDTLSIPPPPPSTASTAKGKSPSPALPRVYVHCSIGEPLHPTDLSTEPPSAAAADLALSARTAPTPTPALGPRPDLPPPPPRGFDRLLTAGFSADEVASLRAQFLAVQAQRHTPDAMPAADELRALEEAWLEADGGGGGGGAGRAPAEGVAAAADDDGLEDMLWGNLMGFFWPVGAVCWLLREEGVWSHRRRIALLSGMMLNLVFGFFRLAQ